MVPEYNRYMVGIQFSEAMRGTYVRHDEPGTRRQLSFRVTAVATSALALARGGALHLHGTLEAEGLAAEAPVAGTMTISPLARRVAYDLDFTADDGRRHRFTGAKNVRLTRIIKSMTEMPGRLFDDGGAEIATCVLLFDLQSELLPMLTSLRTA